MKSCGEKRHSQNLLNVKLSRWNFQSELFKLKICFDLYVFRDPGTVEMKRTRSGADKKFLPSGPILYFENCDSYFSTGCFDFSTFLPPGIISPYPAFLGLRLLDRDLDLLRSRLFLRSRSDFLSRSRSRLRSRSRDLDRFLSRDRDLDRCFLRLRSLDELRFRSLLDFLLLNEIFYARKKRNSKPFWFVVVRCRTRVRRFLTSHVCHHKFFHSCHFLRIRL